MTSDTVSQPTAHGPVEIEWAGGLQFDSGRPGGPKARIDGDARTGPSPFAMLLGAVAACAATDVVQIMEKQRTPLQALRVRVEAQRVGGIPPRSCTSSCEGRVSRRRKPPGQLSCRSQSTAASAPL